MKTWQKIVIGLAILVAMFTGIAFVVLINQLPGSQEIAEKIKQSSSKKTAKINTDTAVNIGKPAKEGAIIDETPKADEEEVTAEKKREELQMILGIIEEDPRDIRVCDNLVNSQQFYNTGKSEDLTFDKIFNGNERMDPFAESMRVPLKAIFQDEQVAGLLQEISDSGIDQMDKRERNSFMEKVGFYSRVTRMGAHMWSRKEEFENLGNRSLHLGIIAKIAAKKPELATSGSLQTACLDLENSLKDRKSVDVKEERKSILKLIKEAGLTPQELDFDPEEYIKFQINTANNGVQFSLSTKDQQASQE